MPYRISVIPTPFGYGEMIRVYNGTDESLVTFTERGIESLQEFLADVRTWEGASVSSSSTKSVTQTSSKPFWHTKKNA